MAGITDPAKGAATGGVNTLLHVEGAVLFVAPSLFYFVSGAPWQLYALLFFVPDLGLLGYLIGPRAGAFAYNTTRLRSTQRQRTTPSVSGSGPSSTSCFNTCF
jgi:hypothetical protein